MHPLAKRHFEKVLGKGDLLGIDTSCRYYPCHRGGLEDCTFCFCPFYPCGDESTGGKWIKGTSWSYEDCSWIHRTEVAGRVLKEMKRLGINKPENIDKNWISLNKIRERVKALYPSQSAAR